MAADDIPNGTSTLPELDISTLHALPSEQQDLTLLNFAIDLNRYVSELKRDAVVAQQSQIKQEVFKIINLSSPAPTRIVRKNAGETLANVFLKGDRKILFETVNDLIGLVGAIKDGKDLKPKHAALYCLGAVLEAAGDSAVGPSVLGSNTILRQLKQASSHAGFRASVFKALGRIYKGVEPSGDEIVAREIWKQARTAVMSDKAHLVQASACWCLEQLVRTTTFFDNSSDFEKLQSAVWKAIENPSSPLRHAAASLLSTALIKNYVDSSMNDNVPRLRRPKKPARKVADGEDDAPDRSESPSAPRSAIQLSFSMQDILKMLASQYVRSGSNNRVKAGITQCYIKLFKGLTERTVETKYGEIALSLFTDILSSKNITSNRYRYLLSRKYVKLVLNGVIGKEILSESAQLDAARFLLNDIVKDYPQVVKERPEPSKHTLTGALSALDSLIKSLGLAISTIQDLCREGLLQVLQHPSYTVQIHASACFRSFVMASPQNLLPSMTICMNSVNRELNLLGGQRRSPRKCVGFANGLATMLSTTPHQPLYGSVDVNARILSQATALLKGAASSELRVSSTQIQVAWIMLGGLMTLGPNFVKIHLSQLLLLWKNALPKALPREHMAQRSFLELSYLAHVRECALGCMMAFLQFNRRLLTTDLTKRLAAMLENTTVFLGTLPVRKSIEDPAQRLSPVLDLHDFELMVRRRVLQCYTRLVSDSPSGSAEVMQQSNLLPFAVAAFADPEDYAPTSMSTSIASAAGSYDSIYEVGDNYGFGVSGLACGFETESLVGNLTTQKQLHWLTRRGYDADIDSALLQPIGRALEHDSINLYIGGIDQQQESSPPVTQVVDAAIRLFAILLPVQTARVQEGVLEQISTFFSSNALQREPMRRLAMTVNVALALHAALQVANKETTFRPGDLRSTSVERAIKDLLHGFVTSPDQYVRQIAGEAIGRLCNTAGNAFTTSEVTFIVDQIVSNRDPAARSGCAVALGCVHTQLGGMAAGFHLKNILGILMSLASDPHAEVHFWAIESLSRVAESAGLTFSGYVTSTLGMAAQLYSSDLHNEEAAANATSNSEMMLPSPAALARCVDSIINVLGPDLQEMTKARDLVLRLVGQFRDEQSELVRIKSVRCLEHLTLFAPSAMDYGAYVGRLQEYLRSDSLAMRSVAVDSFYTLMRRDAEDVVKTAEPGLEEQLWLAYNDMRDQEVIQSIFRNWLAQTGLTNTAQWVHRCNNILTKVITNREREIVPKTAVLKVSAAPELQDEEAAGFAISTDNPGNDSAMPGTSKQQLLRWQVRTFAMDIMCELIAMIIKDVAARDESAAELAFQQSVGEVIRIAFSASTAGVISLRVRGLQIVDHVLRLFGKTPDPEFAEVSLLEQYQAQIGSALTPAFAADSSPELAAQAVNVCATFLATGIVTDVDRMGRIRKLLVSALESFSTEADTASIGDLKGLSSNAMVMVRMAVFKAWAELQVASAEQGYLVDVVAPHLAKLTPLWLSSLREYARLRFEPDASTTMAGPTPTANLDSVYAALNRDTLLKFYQAGWLKFVDAIASLIDQDSDFVFDALDGKTELETNGDTSEKAEDINYRQEPAAFFFVLFGLAFEALAARSDDSLQAKNQRLEILQALKRISKPAVSGTAIYRNVVFSEAMDMMDRLVLMEPLDVQLVIVDIARNLCLTHPSARPARGGTADEETLSEDIEQLFELTRIIVLVLAGLIPRLAENKATARTELNDEATNVLLSALAALVSASSVFPTIIRTDLHACLIHIFVSVLATPSAQSAAIPASLPIFRSFLLHLVREPQQESSAQIRGALAKCLGILKQAQLREIESAVQCEKNVLLATTIMLTTSGSLFNAEDPLLEVFVDELADCLESPLPAKVAAGCCRSLLLGTKPHSADSAISSMIFGKLLEFVAKEDDEEIEGVEDSRKLCCHTLVTFVQGLDASRIGAGIAVVIPALLQRATLASSDIRRDTGAQLLELAKLDQGIFRGVIAALDPDAKLLMEDVIKAVGSGERKTEVAEPTIALRMFGT